jgi:hypothetical protein
MTMDKTDHSPETPESKKPAGFGMARDVRQLRAHGEATADELREFLAETRGRSPQEVLGLVAGSRLTQSIALATVGTIIVLTLGSIGPWFWNRWTAEKTPAVENVAAVPAETETPKAAAESPKAPEPVASAPVAANPTPNSADAKKAVDVMGLNDTKPADLNSNPLENKLDNLLDNLE